MEFSMPKSDPSLEISSSLTGELCAAGRPQVLLQFCPLISQLGLYARAELGATEVEHRILHLKPGEIQRLRCINTLPHTSPPVASLPHRKPSTELLLQLSTNTQLEQGWKCPSSST